MTNNDLDHNPRRKRGFWFWLLRCVSGIGILMCLPALLFGCRLLGDWFQLRIHQFPYFNYSYLTTGLVLTALSGVGLLLGSFALANRRYSMVAAPVALAIGLTTAVSLPDVGPKVEMMNRSKHLLGHADKALALWDEVHGKFPTSDVELVAALKEYPLSDARIFYSGKGPIAYQVRFIPNATKPGDDSVPKEPGVFVYSVRNDFQEYWLMMTTLDDPVSATVIFDPVPGTQRQPWVMSRTHHIEGQPQKGFIE